MTSGVSRRGLFGEGEASGGAGLDGIGLLAAEESGAVVLVALRIAAGDGEGERRRRRRPRRRRAWPRRCRKWSRLSAYWPAASRRTTKWTGPMALGDAFEALAELGVAGGGLGELQFVGGGLEVVAQEGGVVAVARGVDAAATEGARQWSGTLAGHESG